MTAMVTKNDDTIYDHALKKAMPRMNDYATNNNVLHKGMAPLNDNATTDNGTFANDYVTPST
eukprot:CAMPEP_0172486684 /NCGR_PEP_ID=MMETSP1066-20121228/15354_1 /TAXON_ID=671091 /ORGANISM="Coscinodiscus wailesii, Strain CCMP2513" /LENGTH=61 /DNA_ID=CAMNT_0013252785 /DNA_START=134 /DNA_END=316 /DNA_ORIENTATION=+